MTENLLTDTLNPNTSKQNAIAWISTKNIGFYVDITLSRCNKQFGHKNTAINVVMDVWLVFGSCFTSKLSPFELKSGKL